MRILISSISYHPYVSGVSVFARQLAQYLAKQGNEVYVIAPGQRSEPYRERIPDKRVVVIRVPSIANPFRKGFRMPLIARWRLRAIMADIKPDLIHVQDPLPVSWFLKDIARERQIPIIATNHVTIELIVAYLPRILRPIAGWIIRRWLAWFHNQVDLVTCPSKTIQAVMKRDGVRTEILVMSNGIDIARFAKPVASSAIRHEFGLPPKKTIGLYVGRIDKDKSIEVLIRAAAEAVKSLPIHFLIVGGGNLLEPMKSLVARQGLSSDITFANAIPHESPDLIVLYQLADFFITASTIETQGIVVLEAMATGLPIIAPKAGALPELVRPDKNGILVNPGDIAGFVSAVDRVAKDGRLRQTMGRASYSLVRVHDLTTCLGAFETVYHETILTHKKLVEN